MITCNAVMDDLLLWKIPLQVSMYVNQILAPGAMQDSEASSIHEVSFKFDDDRS